MSASTSMTKRPVLQDGRDFYLLAEDDGTVIEILRAPFPVPEGNPEAARYARDWLWLNINFTPEFV